MSQLLVLLQPVAKLPLIVFNRVRVQSCAASSVSLESAGTTPVGSCGCAGVPHSTWQLLLGELPASVSVSSHCQRLYLIPRRGDTSRWGSYTVPCVASVWNSGGDTHTTSRASLAPPAGKVWDCSQGVLPCRYHFCAIPCSVA